MRFGNRIGLVSLVLILLAVAACGKSTGSSNSQTISSPDGVARLVVPQDALPEGIEASDISISTFDTPTSIGFDALPESVASELEGAVEDETIGAWVLEPDGLKFLKPVRLNLSLPEDKQRDDFEFSLVSESDVEYLEPLEQSENQSEVVLEISHFSIVRVGKKQVPIADPTIDSPERVPVRSFFSALAILERPDDNLVTWFKGRDFVTDQPTITIETTSIDRPWTASLHWETRFAVVKPSSEFHNDVDYIESILDQQNYQCDRAGNDVIEVAVTINGVSRSFRRISLTTGEVLRSWEESNGLGFTRGQKKVECVADETPVVNSSSRVTESEAALNTVGWQLEWILSTAEAVQTQEAQPVQETESVGQDPGAPVVQVPDFSRPTVAPPTATPVPGPGTFDAAAPGTYNITLDYRRTNDCQTPSASFSRNGVIAIEGGRGAGAEQNNVTLNDGNAIYRGLIRLADGEVSVGSGLYTGVLDSSFDTAIKNGTDRNRQPKLTFSITVASGCTAVFEVAIRAR